MFDPQRLAPRLRRMVRVAERLPVALVPERSEVPDVRDDVIDLRGGLGASGLDAREAEGMAPQEGRAFTTPAGGEIQVAVGMGCALVPSRVCGTEAARDAFRTARVPTEAHGSRRHHSNTLKGSSR